MDEDTARDEEGISLPVSEPMPGTPDLPEGSDTVDETPAADPRETSALARLLTPVLGRTAAGAVAWVLETVVLLAAAFLLAQVVRTYVVQPYVIPTGSMEPTIAIQDRVLVSKFIYRFRSPERGDVVVFTDPTGETPALIKRVIAVAGQTIDMQDGTVIVDGEPLVEPYTHGKPSEPGGVSLPFTVPEGQVWLMGDNRVNSKDSRWIGPQPVSEVHGRAFAVYWPVERIGPLR